jgi:hypothetical protein
MIKMRKKINCLLLVLYVLYFTSSTLFIHTHFFNWGTVTHSHLYFPFDSDKDVPNHTHTAAQCEFINYIASSVQMITFCMSIIAAVLVLIETYVVFITKHILEFSLNYLFLRAPPSFIY